MGNATQLCCTSIAIVLISAPALAQTVGSSSDRASAGRAETNSKSIPDWSGTWEAVSYKNHMIGHGRAPYRNLDPPFNAENEARFQKYNDIAYAGGTFPSRGDSCTSYGTPRGSGSSSQMRIFSLLRENLSEGQGHPYRRHGIRSARSADEALGYEQDVQAFEVFVS